ncbi:MAG TPA: adenylate kinase [Thermaerobacter sp.]
MDGLAPERRRGRRIVVVGTTGSGKTTAARRLAAILGYPHVELDALHWEPNWTPAPLEIFRHRVREITRAGYWVVDGNYSQVRDVLWPAADTIVWLDYALPVILGRLLRRTTRRALLREELWNGNREDIVRSFLSRDSILLWALRSYRRRRREYPALFTRPEYGHLRVIRLRSPRETDTWLRAVAAEMRRTAG